MLILGENQNEIDQSLRTQKHLQNLCAASQKENTEVILILGEVSEQKPRVPEHHETVKHYLHPLKTMIPELSYFW